MDFFGSPLKTFPLEITILATVKLIEKVEEIKKNIRTWGCRTSCFWVMALWRRGGERRVGGHKFLFSTGQIFCQKLLNHILAMIILKYFRTITHCYAAWFSIKTLFVKLTFSTAYKTEYETKPNDDSESTSKIKESFRIFITSAVICT